MNVHGMELVDLWFRNVFGHVLSLAESYMQVRVWWIVDFRLEMHLGCLIDVLGN